jgi:hypothetical protein
MARAPAGLPAGTRLNDHISLGVIASKHPTKAAAWSVDGLGLT